MLIMLLRRIDLCEAHSFATLVIQQLPSIPSRGGRNHTFKLASSLIDFERELSDFSQVFDDCDVFCDCDEYTGTDMPHCVSMLCYSQSRVIFTS